MPVAEITICRSQKWSSPVLHPSGKVLNIARSSLEKKTTNTTKQKHLSVQNGKQARIKESTPPPIPVNVHWSKGKTQAHSPGSIFCSGIFTGILFAKLLLRSPEVSENEQTVLLSLEKHLLWKQQYGGKKKKKNK